MNKKIFYQDFLMNFDMDSNEFPKVKLKYIYNIDHYPDLNEPDNLFDCIDGKNRVISFQILHDTLNEAEWENMLSKAKCVDMLIIIDDIKIENDEVADMKDFYLKVYYWNFSNLNSNTYIYTNK